MRPISARRSAAVAAALAALVAVVAFGAFLVLRDDQPVRTLVDDFESGALTGWRTVGSGNGGWFVYSDGHKAPDPARSDHNFPFLLPDPPQGKFAAVTDTNGPGTRILYRDVRLERSPRRADEPSSTQGVPRSAAPGRSPGTGPRRTSSSGSTCSTPRRRSTPWRRATCWRMSSVPRRRMRSPVRRPL